MPNNITHVRVPSNEWVDIYALAGVTVGTRLTVENVGAADVYLAVQSTQPAKDHSAYNILKRPPSVPLQNTEGDAGAWAYCPGSEGKLSVSTSLREGFVGGHTLAMLSDGYGNSITSLKNCLDVHIEDVHNTVVNVYAHQKTAVITTFAAASAANDYIINVTDASAFTVGDWVYIDTTSAETTLPAIIAIVGNQITLDRRLDTAHAIGDAVTKVVTDMASQLGTLAAPQEYLVKPPPGQVWHITRLIFSMTIGTAGDLALFGNLPALINGVVLRVRISGVYSTLTNWKINSDMKTDMFDIEFDARSSGGGSYGVSGRGTFTRAGAVLRLDGDQDDAFEVYIQDDIRTIELFTMKLQGHWENA